MKKALFLLFTIAISVKAFSQTMPLIDGLKLSTPADYRAADTIAFQVANYILATPSDEKSTSRLKATKFLIDWMGGSPDYTFDLDKNVVKYFEKDIDLMGVYMASLTASALQNKSVKDSKALTSFAVKKFMAYINNSANNVTLNVKLKKMIEADQKGEL